MNAVRFLHIFILLSLTVINSAHAQEPLRPVSAYPTHAWTFAEFKCEGIKSQLQDFAQQLKQNHTEISAHFRGASQIYSNWFYDLNNIQQNEKVWPENQFLFLSQSEKNLEKSSEAMYEINDIFDRQLTKLIQKVDQCSHELQIHDELVERLKNFAALYGSDMISFADFFITLQSRLNVKSTEWRSLEQQEIRPEDSRFAMLQEHGEYFQKASEIVSSNSSWADRRLYVIIDLIPDFYLTLANP